MTRMTELDDAVEQVLGRYIPDSLWRIKARNEVIALVAAVGLDVFAAVPAPVRLSAEDVMAIELDVRHERTADAADRGETADA